MWLQPIPSSPPIYNRSSKLPALLSPLQGYSQDEVVVKLKDLGAENVEIPAEGFISAEIRPDSVENLEDMAIVEIKHPYQMR